MPPHHRRFTTARLSSLSTISRDIPRSSMNEYSNWHLKISYGKYFAQIVPQAKEQKMTLTIRHDACYPTNTTLCKHIPNGCLAPLEGDTHEPASQQHTHP